MRGTRLRRARVEGLFRFIPAGAGNTDFSIDLFPLVSVHPRGCGEHALSVNGTTISTGSSPRVRGTPTPYSGCYCLSRFIPAGAGNTPAGDKLQSFPPVHPRGCGEHARRRRCGLLPRRFIPAGAGNTHSNCSANCSERGSSPRVRGTPLALHIRLRQRRFIPAGAGNTREAIKRGRPVTVHPRGCGEH